MIDLGDTFAMDDVTEGEVAEAEAAYEFQLPFFNIVSGNTAIFLAPGNHEQQEAWHLDGTADSISVLGTNAEKKYFLNPVPDGSFYTGDEVTYPYLSGDQLKQDYYAFEWGDALFVVINPYWYTTTKPYISDLGGGEECLDWFRRCLGLDSRVKRSLNGSSQLLKTVLQLISSSSPTRWCQTPAFQARRITAMLVRTRLNLVEWGGYNEDGINLWLGY